MSFLIFSRCCQIPVLAFNVRFELQRQGCQGEPKGARCRHGFVRGGRNWNSNRASLFIRIFGPLEASWAAFGAHVLMILGCVFGAQAENINI